ncbi:DUF262 domain-containing protein [Microbacterium sp. JZ70]|uniref:GmrSD restriction endonucleases N-terminal domain-containing protein n=1 Tax=Microbacterium barkeri TaxID=33917 RepID=A0A9W6H508_9MICO|nr:DUF262 domain-containing protein [Microbacterium barkeri]MDI6944452.1 DUF262 domain-containing protein [Microbacterium barkeri]MDR6877529.1 hypothetical protein [Microbacterium barkeri]GLJ62466.1 hypothetical protein GCM10017576_25960 [Microbacterium barkeri]
MENPEPRAQYLNVVLRQIDRTSLRIPRFQRHFVWDESDVLELLESIKRGYPIGSVLTWKVESADGYFSGFRTEAFPEADERVTSFEVILDGAQRLSSLYGCLRHPDASPKYKIYYDADSDEFVHADSVRSLEAWHVPMSALFDSRSFLKVQGDIAALENGEALLPRALDLYATFQDYQVPIIALSNARLEDVVEVFRRVNSSGTPLSSVDFVRALTWRSNFDLEDTFDTLSERFRATPLDGLNDEFLIRCLSVAAGLSLDSRDVGQLKNLSLRPGGLSNEVSEMEAALDRMSEFLQRLAISGLSEVPYEAQRLILFGIMLFKVKLRPAEIEDWLWRSTFAEEYQSKPESYLTRLIREVKGGDPVRALEVRKPIEPDLFVGRVRRGGSAVTIGFDLLLRREKARSLLSGEVVGSSEGQHEYLFTREQLSEGTFGRVASAALLANLVLLTAHDALTWRKMRKNLTLRQMYEECERRTGDAAEIWRSQGLVLREEESPTSVLENRSSYLVGRVTGRGFA